ncbi:FAD-binding dehydrogenase [Corynebacterium hansenii]|uniref:FAD-binding dehydrogenase n=1 Tax=Corynebacterium hansenii TaxID=394964 RepID=A0ABV7ZU96_9CORY|nr:FAD-binding dehydrogenase [Corynebacterium hansenii]WJZ00079.1 KsdD-like steroid dehydrogenase [Corynebacterium hansenii]
METNGETAKQQPLIVVGAGLAGLVAAYEAQRTGRKVIIVDQENEANIGGQAFWSLGGIFLIDSPEQRRLKVKDSRELARSDWFGSAEFDRPEDFWPGKWAEAYLDFAAGEKREYLRDLGVKFVPVVGWAERGDGSADGHGNSVPRFHLTWGTGPEIVRVFAEPLKAAANEGRVEFHHRHRVDEIIMEDGRAVGVRGRILVPCDGLPRGVASPREEVGETFEIRGGAVLIATGGVGGNLEAVRRCWPEERLGAMPDDMVVGVPAHVDGRGIDIAGAAGAHLINRDRMWHYAEGMANWDPIWPGHGIRIIPGPSSLWFDAEGNRLPAPLIPGADTVKTMKHILSTGHGYSWFVLNGAIVAKEFLFSGSEQNPDLTDKQIKKLMGKVTAGIPDPVRKFMDNGEDWVVAETLEELVAGMNRVAGVPEELIADGSGSGQGISLDDGPVPDASTDDVDIAVGEQDAGGGDAEDGGAGDDVPGGDGDADIAAANDEVASDEPAGDADNGGAENVADDEAGSDASANDEAGSDEVTNDDAGSDASANDEVASDEAAGDADNGDDHVHDPAAADDHQHDSADQNHVSESPVPVLDVEHLRRQIEARDRQTVNAFSKDYQVNYVHVARKFLGDKLIRTVPQKPILDPTEGPLIAVRLRMLTRKTLGGIETDLDGRVMRHDGTPIEGLFAAGEASGFGGGGMHGNNALEGTFLGGCIFSGMRAGRGMAGVAEPLD